MTLALRISICVIICGIFLYYTIRNITKEYREMKRVHAKNHLCYMIRCGKWHDLFIEKASKTEFQAKTREECQMVSDIHDLGIKFDDEMYMIVVEEVQLLNSL